MPKLNTYVHVGDKDHVVQAFGPDDKVPEWAVKAITNPSVWADESASDDGPSENADDGAAPSYTALTKAELEAEVDRRNEGRGDEEQIEVGGKGNKSDLVAALEADDAATDGAGE